MTNKFRLMLLSMAAVGLVGCSDKLVDDIAQQGQGEDAENYVVFKIGSIGSETRAGEGEDPTPGNSDFHAGLAEEHAVSAKAGANVVYFFDDKGNSVATSMLEVLGQQESDDATGDNHNGSYDSNAQEKVYQARIKGTKETIKEYKQCLIVLNGNPNTLDNLGQQKLTLSDILKELNEGMGWYTEGDTKYFTMTNTVYVDGKDLNIKSAKEIDPDDQIRATMEEAQKHPIVVHVERVLAKFGLNQGSSDSHLEAITKETEIEPTPNATAEGSDDKNLYITLMTSNVEEEPTGDVAAPGEEVTGDDEDPDHYKTEWVASNRKWKVNIKGWGMNATETKTFWFKNLKDKEGDLATFDSKGQFGKWTRDYQNTIGWNDYARLRSYWAVDPHYNGNGSETSENYPHQYRDAKDNEKNIVSGNDGQGQNGLKTGFVLNYNNYYSFAKFPTNGYNYTVENTFAYDWFTSSSSYDYKGYDYKRTSTHAIIAAELLIANEEGDNPSENNYSAKTVYQYDGYYWEAREVEPNNENRYADMPNSLKKYMLNQVIFHWSLDNSFNKLYTDDACTKELEASSTNFDEYFEVVAATIDGGDGRAMMQMKSSKVLYFKDVNGVTKIIGNVESTEENNFYKKFTEDVLYEYGTARRYHEGKMYYYIPIKHMSADNGGLTKDDYEYNVGRWGVVRNHWYRLNINAIKNPGIPVDDPEQPIIPNDDPDEDYYAAFEIVILPWHVIDNDVTFE